MKVAPLSGHTALLVEGNSDARQAGFDHHLVKPVKPDALDRLFTEL